jgi:hypothetical protein
MTALRLHRQFVAVTRGLDYVCTESVRSSPSLLTGKAL